MKTDFESVVRENTSWILSYVKRKISNKEIAEDIVQEVWIKAFRAYDNYIEAGKLKSWLMRITQNTVRNYYASSQNLVLFSLDAEDDDNDPIYNYLSEGLTPEEEYLNAELMDEVLSVIAKLPKENQQIITLRFIDGFPVSETSKIVGIPQGSVKSKTHYSLREIRKHFGIYESKKKKGKHAMECNDIYKYLFMYALGKLPEDKVLIVSKHIEKCEMCSNIVMALKELIPQISIPEEDKYTIFLVHFPEIDTLYMGSRCPKSWTDEMIRKINEINGKVPENVNVFRGYWSKTLELAAYFDCNGFEIPFKVFDANETHSWVTPTYVYKGMDPSILYGSFMSASNTNKVFGYIKNDNSNNEYTGKIAETYGGICTKSAIYQAVPKRAENFRIKRGNGIISTKTYNFAYTDRYLGDGEENAIEYTFDLND